MSLPSQPDLNGGLGSLLIGVCANLLLFSQETTLLGQIFRRNWRAERHDSVALQVGLGCMYLADLTGTAAGVFCIYGYAITGWGNTDVLFREDISMPLAFIATGCSAIFCQSFLIHRILHLTKSYILSSVLALYALASFGGSVAAAVTLLLHNTYAQRSANVVPVTIWLLCSAVADLLIAGVLSVFLWRARKTAARFDGSRLKGPLTKALHQTLECGGVVTAAALSALGVYLHDHVTNISVGIGFILGRLYALTILYCLFQRGASASDSSHAPSLPSAKSPKARPSSSFWDRGRQTTHWKSAGAGGVTVHEETVVAHDVATDLDGGGESVYELGRLERAEERIAGAPVDPRLYMVRGLTPEPGGRGEADEKGGSPESVRGYGYI